MKNNRALLIIFLIVFIDLFGFSLILPLLPFIAEKYNADPFRIGLLTSTYSLFQLFSAPILGRLSDKYGRRPLLIISQLGSAIGFVMLGMANSMVLLFASRIIDGVTGGNISVAQAYIADITNKKNRARGMGMIGAAFGLGFILGPAIGGALSNISFSLPAYFAAGISIFTAFFTYIFLKEPKSRNIGLVKKSTLSLKDLKKILLTYPLGLLIGVFFLQNLSFAGMQANFALWTERTFGYGPSQNGLFFALIGVVAVITQLILLPRLVKLFGERKLLAVGLGTLSVGLLGVYFGQFALTILFLSLVMLAVGNGLANPTLQAIASESVSKNNYGEVLGILQSAGSLARVFGPAMAGYLFEKFNKDVPFITSSFIMMMVCVIVLHFLPRGESVFVRVLNKIRG